MEKFSIIVSETQHSFQNLKTKKIQLCILFNVKQRTGDSDNKLRKIYKFKKERPMRYSTQKTMVKTSTLEKLVRGRSLKITYTLFQSLANYAFIN